MEESYNFSPSVRGIGRLGGGGVDSGGDGGGGGSCGGGGVCV